MPREILVATPENIEIEYELAGAGSRFVANMFDALMQFLLFLGLLIVGYIVDMLLGLSHAAWARATLDFLENILQALLSIAVFVVLWGYFIWFELRWNGQTPGKRQQGLRVVRDGGYPVNAYAVLTRNLLRVVDGIPIMTLGLVGAGLSERQYAGYGAIGGLQIVATLGFVLLSARNQRLGDFVAGTMVVKQRAPRVPTLEALAPPPRVLPEHLAAFALADIGRHVYEMTVPEYRAVRHAIDRRWQMPMEIQQQAAARLAVPLMERLGIHPPEGVVTINYADLLEYLAVAFEQYRGVK